MGDAPSWARRRAEAGDAPEGSSHPGSAGATAQAWIDATERWWRHARDSVPREAHPFFETLIRQAGAYFQLSERILNALGGDDRAEQGHSEQVRSGRGQPGDPLASLDTRGWLAFWQHPLSAWIGGTATAPFAPRGGAEWAAGDPARARAAGDALEVSARTLLEALGPGVPATWQREQEEGLRCWAEYQRALADYTDTSHRIGIDALERLRERVAELAARGERIDSLRRFYDLWVECGEAAYEERVRSVEYARLYGRVVNGLMGVRRHTQRLTDQIAAALDLPTRAEQDAVHARLHALRLELQTLRAMVHAQANDSRAGTRTSGDDAGSRARRKRPRQRTRR